MSKEMFINKDKKAIRALLKEIGKARYEAALIDAGLQDMKPIGLDGFYVEWIDGDVQLWYRYPIGKKFKLIDVLGFWAVPIDGWERSRK
ncbi:hypothetical protein [Maribacter aquivivus]|uniref:hypothetical protein n=1 Tax=Maribacter aquivivus TaxID=228958 RepID=UPI0024945D78|nr:hypothetical protein [Maribacter aquivivus]